MAKITELTILNSSDKGYKFAVATGKGAVADADDPIVVRTDQFPIGSQYVDLTNKKLYIRTAAAPAVADWTVINAG